MSIAHRPPFSFRLLTVRVHCVRDRILGNPRFLLVLAIEEAMGVSAKLSAEVNARGDNFQKVWPSYAV